MKKMDNCVKEILCRVKFVERIGTPGRLIVFGENAEAILTGQNEEDTVVAAAEVGKGRIVVFSHTSFGKQMIDQTKEFSNSTFYKNVRNWVTKKNQNVGYKILSIENQLQIFTLEDLQKYDILFSVGGREHIRKKLVIEYIEAGGAFVMSVTAWGWMQCNPNKPISDIPYCSILIKNGISFSKDISQDVGGGYAPEMNLAPTANLSKIWDNFKDLDAILEKIGLIKMINELPSEFSACLCDPLMKYWEEVEKEINCSFPNQIIKTRNLHQKELLEFWSMCANVQDNWATKAPCIKEFPGDFEKPPLMTNKTVKFHSKLEDVFFTGCYVVAGTKASIKVAAIRKAWKVLIGAHTDYLTSDKVLRWPNIVKRHDVCGICTYDISSPFGGGVYFVSSNWKESKIEATICNIVIQPFFDSQNLNSKNTWKENRKCPGLWADLKGKHVTFTFPSASIRALEDPTEILNMYDKLIESYHDLRGTDIEVYRKIWIVADIQPKVGYMHAGYPIVTKLDVTDPADKKFLFNVKSFKKEGFWGIFHEIGHNMQKSIWTFEGTLEVTVNIFTLYGMHTICNLPTWIHPWLQKQLKAAIKYLKNGADFSMWKRNPGAALVIYAQLAHHFGWDAYKKVFRYYEKMASSKRPKTSPDKIDVWFSTFSRVAGYNLEPLAMFWGFEISQKEKKRLESLKLKFFLPSDEVTEEVPDRVSLIEETFPSLIRKLE